MTLTKNRQVYPLNTESNGWVYVKHYSGKMVSLNLENLYDTQGNELPAIADESNAAEEKTKRKKKPRNRR